MDGLGRSVHERSGLLHNRHPVFTSLTLSTSGDIACMSFCADLARLRRPLLTLAAVAAIFAVAFVPATAAAPTDHRYGIAEGIKDEGLMASENAGFERVIVPWNQIQPTGPSDFSHLGQTLSKSAVQGDVGRGVQVVGLLEFTPDWAASNPSDQERSVPKNLNLAWNDPNNYWGQFVYQTVKYYAGTINDWVLWNEPGFRATDTGAGGSYTWAGSDQDFAQLMKVGYLAAKAANPSGSVSFPATSYWDEELAQPSRDQFYDRLLNIFAQDPAAAPNNWYHDEVSLNLYRAPDDVFRVYSLFKAFQKSHGIDKPIWLTETNAMPSDDTQIPCAAAQAANAFVPTTMQQQAAYAPQAFALAMAAGYAHAEFYQMTDSDTCSQPAVWGLARDDGSQRPVAQSLKNFLALTSDFGAAQFVPVVRFDQGNCPCWPDAPAAYVTNYQIYQIAFDMPGSTRVTMLWNGDGQPNQVNIPVHGTSAVMVDRDGNQSPIQPSNNIWTFSLPAATAHFHVNDFITDPAGYYYIGGDPVYLVESGVSPSTPVAEPTVGSATQAADFNVLLDPSDGQTVPTGSPADYTLHTEGVGGFNNPIALSITQWSTQRFPTPQDPSSLPLAVSYPSTVTPGQTATIHIDSSGASSGIYYVDFQADGGGGLTHTVELALVLN